MHPMKALKPTFLSTCPQCGTLVEAAHPVCPYCGTPLAQAPAHPLTPACAPATASPQRSPQGRNSQRGVLFLVALSCFLLLVTVGVPFVLMATRESSEAARLRCERELPRQMEAYYRSVGRPYPVKSVTLREVSPYHYEGFASYQSGYVYHLSVEARYTSIEWETATSGIWKAP